jgi:8-oxo-dGTP pyrophosphatase MutT (NUDIX family)
MSFAPCAGVIVFDKNKTILVCTEKGYYSMPKGKRKRYETDIQTALRELEEETGLTVSHIELLNDFQLDEINDKGHLTVRYFVAKLVREHTTFVFDINELDKVEWIDIEQAYKLEKFLDRRKNILRKAHEELLDKIDSSMR